MSPLSLVLVLCGGLIMTIASLIWLISAYTKKKKTVWIAIFVFVISIAAIVLGGVSYFTKSYFDNLYKKTYSSSIASNTQDYSKVLKFDIINSRAHGNSMVGVKVKITNLTGKHIERAQATCILKNSEGYEIGFQKHYVIKSTEGGLTPFGSTYFTYVVDSNYKYTKGISFKIDSIKFK